MFSAALQRTRPPTFTEQAYQWIRLALHSPCRICNQFCNGQELCNRCLADIQAARWGVSGLHFAQQRIPVLWRETYGGPLTNTIVRAKYFGDWGAARLLGSQLGRLPKPWLGESPVLLPIPLAGRRLASRGFNQSQWIAKSLAKSWQVPLQARWLRKIKTSARQASLARKDRQSNLFGLFQASDQVRDQRVVLIDDIMTSGATLKEAARAVQERGGIVIAAAVIARVQHDQVRLQSSANHPHHVQRRLIRARDTAQHG